MSRIKNISISAYPNERYFEFNSKKVVKTDGKISLRSLIHLILWSILLTMLEWSVGFGVGNGLVHGPNKLMLNGWSET